MAFTTRLLLEITRVCMRVSQYFPNYCDVQFTILCQIYFIAISVVFSLCLAALIYDCKIIQYCLQDKKMKASDFCGGPVVENTFANEYLRVLKFWSRMIPHDTKRLSPCTTTTKSMLSRAHTLQQEKPSTNSPLTTHRE